MKKITFYIGDFISDYDKYICIDVKDLSLILSKNIENKPYLINSKELNLRKDDIKSIVSNSNTELVIVFNTKPEWIKEFKDKVEIIDKSDKKKDFIYLLELILFEKDRDKVLNELNNNSSIPYHLVLKWCYGCYKKFNQKNLEILDEIDTMIFKAKPQYINVMFSSMLPEKKPFNIWQFLGKYKFKKEE